MVVSCLAPSRRCLAALLLGTGLQSFGVASAQTPISPTPAGVPPPAVAAPSFASLAAAATTGDRTLVQLRRIRGENGAVTTLREQLIVNSSSTAQPRFDLTFLGVEGELPGSPLTQRWQAVHGRLSPLLLQHSFRVRDAGRAQANYVLHDFGAVTRANRTARRLVLFPTALDKGLWLVDVDEQTHIPLYTAEFDMQLRLLSETEVVSLQLSAPALSGAASGSTSGAVFTTFTAAVAVLADSSGVVDPDTMIVSEYALQRIEVRVDPLNGQQKLAMTWTDGIDQFYVTQTPGVANAFASLPASRGGHAIGRYRNAASTQLLFWDDGVSVAIEGAGSLRRLDELAKRIYRQALSN
jgi:hypothetical protein